MKPLTAFQQRAVEILKPPRSRQFYCMNVYDLASRLYADRWEDNYKGHACLIGTMQRSLFKRPDVFVTWVETHQTSPGRYVDGGRQFSLDKEFLAMLTWENDDGNTECAG